MIITSVIIILFITLGMSLLSKEEDLGKGTIIGDIIVPVQKVFRKMDLFVSEKIYHITHVSDIKKENEQLKKEIALLKEEIYQYENLISQQDFLKNSSILLEEGKYDYIPATIVSKDSGMWFNRFVLDHGEADGILKDSMVVVGVQVEEDIYDASIVGRVVEVGSHWAKVVAIIDKGSNVSVKVLRTGAQGIIEGSEERILNGFLFDVETDVRIGDLIYTTATGGHFKDGLYVGRVEDVEIQKDQLLKTIKVAPQVDFKNLSRVYVIKKVEE